MGVCVPYPPFSVGMNDLKETPDEKNVPALENQAATQDRFPGAHGHQGRSQGPGPSPAEGAEEAQHLTCPAAAPRGSRRLSRRQRLRASALFEEAFNGGRRCHGRLLVMWMRTGPGASLRLGVVASRRAFRRSVDRSRAKRLLREAYRLNRSLLSGAVDVVLVGRRDILTASRQDVERDLMAVAARAGLVRGGRR